MHPLPPSPLTHIPDACADITVTTGPPVAFNQHAVRGQRLYLHDRSYRLRTQAPVGAPRPPWFDPALITYDLYLPNGKRRIRDADTTGLRRQREWSEWSVARSLNPITDGYGHTAYRFYAFNIDVDQQYPFLGDTQDRMDGVPCGTFAFPTKGFKQQLVGSEQKRQVAQQVLDYLMAPIAGGLSTLVQDEQADVWAYGFRSVYDAVAALRTVYQTHPDTYPEHPEPAPEPAKPQGAPSPPPTDKTAAPIPLAKRVEPSTKRPAARISGPGRRATARRVDWLIDALADTIRDGLGQHTTTASRQRFAARVNARLANLHVPLDAHQPPTRPRHS